VSKKQAENETLSAQVIVPLERATHVLPSHQQSSRRSTLQVHQEQYFATVRQGYAADPFEIWIF
jgi:hypothetical protein